MNTTPGTQNEERNERGEGSFPKRNDNEDSEYSDSFVEHLFNVNRKGPGGRRGNLYGQGPQFENDPWDGDCNWYDAEEAPGGGGIPYVEAGEQEGQPTREDEDVMKYYAVVKSNKMNDQILQREIDHLLNFSSKVETYEEKQKKLLWGSANDEGIDPCLCSWKGGADQKDQQDEGDAADQQDEGDEASQQDDADRDGTVLLPRFVEDLRRVKKHPLRERAEGAPPSGDKVGVSQPDGSDHLGGSNHLGGGDHLGGSEIAHSLNSTHITFNEKRLLNMSNIHLNNLLYFYLCCNEDDALACLEGGGKRVYTYDSYAFEGLEGGSEASSNAPSEGSSRSSSISDEELLLLRYGDDEGGGYAGECDEADCSSEEEGCYSEEADCHGEDSGRCTENPLRRRKRKRSAKRGRHGGKGASATPSPAEPTKMSKEVESLMNKANSCYISQNFDECIAVLEKVIKLAPSLHDPFHLLGLIQEREYKNVKKAINYYLIAAHLSRNDHLSWYNLIELCKMEKQYRLILYCLFKVLRIYKKKIAKREKRRIVGGSPQGQVDYKGGHPSCGDDHGDAIPKEGLTCDEYLRPANRNEHMKELDPFLKHLYFNVAFTYLLLEDYKNGLKWLLLLRNACGGEVDTLVDLYICLCLAVVRNPHDSYHFLKRMFLRVVRGKRRGGTAPLEERPPRADGWSYKEKSTICFFMQSQILNGKYDECIFVFWMLTRMSSERIHVDVFTQFVRALLMVGHVDYGYLTKCHFVQVILGNLALFEDLVFHLAEAYYARGMFEGAIYFYRLVYARRKGGALNEAVNEAASEAVNESVRTISPGKEQPSPDDPPSLRCTKRDTLVGYEGGVHLPATAYKLVKCHYYLQNYTKAEKIIAKMLKSEHLKKHNLEIDIKTLYIDILHKTKRHNKAISILLTIKQKKLRFMGSIPTPLGNKERELLLLKILNRKNKLLLYLSHNSYILHMFYVYQKKESVFHQHDHFLPSRDVNDIIRLRENICFCYFCVRYNFSVLGLLYLYNVLLFLGSTRAKGNRGHRGHRGECGEHGNRSTRARLRRRIASLHTYREYVVFLATSFRIFKRGEKPEDLDIVHKDLRLAGTRLYYRGALVFDVQRVLAKRAAMGTSPNDVDAASPTAANASSPNATSSASPTAANAALRSRLRRHARGVELEIFSSKIVVKFYKFSYSFFSFLYETEQDFKRVHTAMEKDVMSFRRGRSDVAAVAAMEASPGGWRSLFVPPGYAREEGEPPSGSPTGKVAPLPQLERPPLEAFPAEEAPKRSKRFSFLMMRKKMNLFSFENYLGLYFSLLFLEECLFIVTTMNMYEDAIHILSVYLKNRKSSKMKFLTYMKAVKREFQKHRISNRFRNVGVYFFNSTYSGMIKEEMRSEYKNFCKMNEHVDCKYFLFRINLLLNRLYISSGDFERQVKCLNDVYIFKRKEKDEYKVLKYYCDIVLTGPFCQNYLSSISRSRHKNILITFRLFLVRTLHCKNSNPFLIYLIGNVCNLSCMIVNSVHEHTRAYAFLLKGRKANRQRLLRGRRAKGVKGVKRVKGRASDSDGGAVGGAAGEAAGGAAGQPDGEVDDQSDDQPSDAANSANPAEELEEEHFLFSKLQLCGERRRRSQAEDGFEGVADELNFLFSLMTSYFNYASGYRVQNRESVMMTSFCLLNDYIGKRYHQKVIHKKKKYKRRSLFYKPYKYIYTAEILYNLGRALHQLSYFSECMKLYMSVIRLVRRADKQVKRICSANKLLLNRRFILEHVVNMNRCMCFSCLYFCPRGPATPLNHLANYYGNLNTKYCSLFLLFFDRRHLLFSAAYNLGVIFRKLNRFEQAKHVLGNILWD
ncbi:hypothetical protein PVNG_04276 [Plasmodium vivax North Korean]|uniref:Uncharacterized protein n=1 Tax=Plasmodium vivax North Korean TaxID=1035514 RepID=A0A0J9TSQ0_PLAVI|nr:hypothetical protein PVNG_04276 [Plasmodium vivax North Korean]